MDLEVNWEMMVDSTLFNVIKRCATYLYHTVQRLGGWRRATVVVYHSINEPPDRYTVTPSAFARQIRLLRDHFEIVPLGEIRAALDEPKSHRRRVAITFDDALVDFQVNAYEVLKNLRVPATIFVPTGMMGRTNEWDAENDRPTLSIMTLDQIRNLNMDELIDIGSHTISHSDMGTLSEENMRTQVEKSKQALEELLGTPIKMFAYPYGGYENFSRRSTQVLRNAGYDIAVTTVWGTQQSPRNLLTLRRIFLDDSDTDEDVFGKANGDYDWRGIRQLAGHVLRTLKQLTLVRGNV